MSGIVKYFAGQSASKEYSKAASQYSEYYEEAAKSTEAATALEVEAIKAESKSTIASYETERDALVEGYESERDSKVNALSRQAESYTENAGRSIDAMRIDLNKQRRENEQVRGTTTVAVNTSGFAGAGFEDTIRQNEREMALDEMLIRREGKMRAYDYYQKAEDARAEADDIYEATSKKISSTKKAYNTKIEGVRTSSAYKEKSAALSGSTKAKSYRSEGSIKSSQAKASSKSAKYDSYAGLVDAATAGYTAYQLS